MSDSNSPGYPTVVVSAKGMDSLEQGKLYDEVSKLCKTFGVKRSSSSHFNSNPQGVQGSFMTTRDFYHFQGGVTAVVDHDRSGSIGGSDNNYIGVELMVDPAVERPVDLADRFAALDDRTLSADDPTRFTRRN